MVKSGVRYSLQCYKGEHKNEYTMRSDSGDTYLYNSGILKMHWKEDDNGSRVGGFTVYNKGKVDFVQRFKDILEQQDFNRIVNHSKGLRMEITSKDTDYIIYHGEFNEKRQRDGWGIEYDKDTGLFSVEGIWKRDSLVEVRRIFEDDVMIEFKREGDNLCSYHRIPVYIGGFCYDNSTEKFYRDGVGCIIDEKTGIATREGEWKDGEEISGRDLSDGWCNPLPLKVTVIEPRDLTRLSLEVTDLVIDTTCCSEMTKLDLSKFTVLSTLEIGDNCFGSVDYFRIDGLNKLKSIKIGKNSFTLVKDLNWDTDWDEAIERANNRYRSFHILNCEQLKSIEIKECSFSDYGGPFELDNLPSLESIKIGVIGSKSRNFRCTSFVVRGETCGYFMRNRSSKAHFHYVRLWSVLPCVFNGD